MNILALTVTVAAPRETVFNFLADIESLPKWSGGYFEEITLQRGRWWALTADGEQVVDMEAGAGAGVIDLHVGPGPESMTLTPIRVVELTSRLTLISIMLLEAADRGPENFARRCRIWREAVAGLPRRFGGGEVHSDDRIPQLMELGLN